MSEEKGNVPVLRLAAKNFRAYAWINCKVAFVFACLAFLVCLFTGYNSALAGKREALETTTLSARYVCLTSTTEKNFPWDFAEEYFPGQEGIGFWRQRTYLYMNERLHLNLSDAICRYIVFTAEGEELAPRDDTLKINCYAASYPFTEDDKAELLARTGSDEILIGRVPQTEDEIVLAEPFLENYGLGQDFLGKEVSVQVTGDSAPLFGGTLVGIVKKEYYGLSGHDDWTHSYLPVTMVCDGHPLFKKTGSVYSVAFKLDRLYTREEAKTIADDVVGRFKSAVTITYGGNRQTTALWMLENVLILANTLYVIIGSSLAVGLVLTVFLMMGKYMKVFARAGGMFLTYGLPQKKLILLLFTQLMLLAAISVPMSAFLSVLGYFVIGAAMFAATGVAMEITVEKFLLMLIIGIVIVVAVSLFIFLLMVLRLRKRSIRELLVTEVN